MIIPSRVLNHIIDRIKPPLTIWLTSWMSCRISTSLKITLSYFRPDLITLITYCATLTFIYRTFSIYYELSLTFLILRPSNEEEAENDLKEFEYPLGNYGARYLPGVIGAIDGKLVNIHRPGSNSESFRDRKFNLSINLTAVCDNDCKFRYIHVGESGRTHDARVLSRSDIPYMMSDPDVFFPNNTYIIGDSAYPLSPFLIVPYSNATDPLKIKFNEKLSSMCSCVERAFGQLTKRWRFLFKYLYLMEHSRLVRLVTCCCILHNLRKYMNDIDSIPDDPAEVDVADMISDLSEHQTYEYPERNRREGLSKREELTATVSLL